MHGAIVAIIAKARYRRYNQVYINCTENCILSVSWKPFSCRIISISLVFFYLLEPLPLRHIARGFIYNVVLRLLYIYSEKASLFCSTFKSRSICQTFRAFWVRYIMGDLTSSFFIPIYVMAARIISFFGNFCIFQPITLFKLAIIDKGYSTRPLQSRVFAPSFLYFALLRSLLKIQAEYILIMWRIYITSL